MGQEEGHNRKQDRLCHPATTELVPPGIAVTNETASLRGGVGGDGTTVEQSCATSSTGAAVLALLALLPLAPLALLPLAPLALVPLGHVCR